MRSVLIFTLKVWLTTIVLGAVFVIAFIILSSPSENMQWKFMPTFLFFIMLYSMMLSLPTLLVFYIVSYGLAISKLSIVWNKIILTSVGILGCILTLPFLIHHKSLINQSSLIFIACYGLPLTFSTMYYRLNSNLKINNFTSIY